MILNGQEILAVVSDLDGTIIPEGGAIPPESFFVMVEKLLEKGIPFVAASGRQYLNIRKILGPIADKINYIAENGCLVIYKEQVIYKNTIERGLAMQLIDDISKQEGTEIMVSGENTGYLISHNEEFIAMLRDKIKYQMVRVDDYTQVQEEMLKISIYWKEGIPSGPEEWFHKKYDDLLQVANGGNGWLDFNGKGSGKGPALKVLADKMGIPVSKMVAFGDNENDITMLQEAGISYAVSSAKPHVKEEADYVCDSVETVILDALK